MEEIKIGDFARTKDGYIAKLVSIGNYKYVSGICYIFDNSIQCIDGTVYEVNNFLYESDLNRIVKYSTNLIDLIEERRYS